MDQPQTPSPNGTGMKDLSRINNKYHHKSSLTQIHPSTFWTYIESFFKPLTENDLTWLHETPDPSLFIVPPLGNAVQPEPHTLTQKLFSTFIEEDDLSLLDTMDIESPPNTIIIPDRKSSGMDTQIQKRLALLDIFDEDNENDRVCETLKILQSRLKEVTRKNQHRKQLLHERIMKCLPWQEYHHIMDNMYRQLEILTGKKYSKPPLSKKKKRPGQKSLHTSIDERLVECLDNKNTLLSTLGNIIPRRTDIQTEHSEKKLFLD